MATITKRGDTYRIRCSLGYDSRGKQIIRSTTWKPEPGMTPKQEEKELNRFAVLFEEKCKSGGGTRISPLRSSPKSGSQSTPIPT